ncbi:MAG: twin-arginine translocase subunit TatC [Gammaproteobacteria bacterium]|nr:MAG: twin-arginine translocase subunit TatC [Gammaproteobacteria bacterium]PIE36971.1 MAG: twin-arginine translocase subunit TatC [Gammaproteobacteria bacterium]
MMTSPDDSHIDQEEGFLSHLIELRDRLLRIVLVITALFAALFWKRDVIYTALADPLLKHLPDSQMIATQVASPFLVPFKLTLMLCIFLAVPYILYQIWAFVAPGLYRHEQRLVLPMLVSSTLLFYLGVLFAYYVVFPLVFGFFVQVAPEGVEVNTDISSYLDFVITLFFAFGLAFEVPVATVLVVALGLTTPEQLVKARPYVFVAAFVIGMFLTPPDMISQTLLAIPMWLLYEVGIVFSRLYKDRIREAFGGDDDETAGASGEQAMIAAGAAGAASGTGAGTTGAASDKAVSTSSTAVPHADVDASTSGEPKAGDETGAAAFPGHAETEASVDDIEAEREADDDISVGSVRADDSSDDLHAAFDDESTNESEDIADRKTEDDSKEDRP